MAANSATAIPNAGMGAGTNNASAIVFRPIVWGDLDAVVDLFDRTWPQDVDKVGADMSRLISRYFVLHYLLPTTFANGAFAADGTLAGVTFIRVAGEAPQLDEIEVGEEMKALERRIDADPEAAKHMAALKSGFSVELDLEREGRANETTMGELELFIVNPDVRGHGVGGQLWRRMQEQIGRVRRMGRARVLPAHRFRLRRELLRPQGVGLHRAPHGKRDGRPARRQRRRRSAATVRRHVHLPGKGDGVTSAKPQSQSHEPHESQKTQSPYAQLFRIPGTKAFCVSGAIARLPMSMMGLGIVLALNHMYDNWTIAGVMSAAYVLATAAVTPLYARLFDRFGQRKVGPVILTVQIIVMLGFAFAALMRVPIPLLFVLAVVMGMTQFSFGALVRTRWAYVLDRADKEDLLNTAYALESAIDEIVFIFGPILAAFLAASVHPVSQLFVPTLACAFGGAVFFALRDTQPPVLREITVVAAGTDDADVRLAAGGAAGAAVSADRFDLDRLKTGDRDRRKRNVLTYAGVLPLLAVFIVFNMAFTAFDTSMTAVMKSLHLDSVLGVQLAMLAVGSCMGALVFGSRELKGSRWRHMIMFLALMTVGFVVIHLCQGNLIVMGLVEILTGLTISPVFASGNLLVKETVPEESLTEGLSWVSTAGTMGASFGSMITGIVLDHFNPSVGLSLPAVFVGCSIPFALIGWLLARRSVSLDS